MGVLEIDPSKEVHITKRSETVGGNRRQKKGVNPGAEEERQRVLTGAEE